MNSFSKLITVLTLILLMLSPLLSMAQSSRITYQLSAKVFNEEKQAVEIGNAVLLSPTDSALIGGKVFFDGFFEIDYPNQEAYILQITSVGYQDYYLDIPERIENLILKDIVLTSVMLEGVDITARQSLYEQRGENVVIHVEKTSLSNAGTAMDVLRRSPKIILNSSNEIQVIGKGAALVYVDGQLLSSTQMLQSLGSDDIQEIEVIENPSAKYDAAGNAIIHIKTKKKSIEGYKIGVLSDLEHGMHPRGYFKLNTYYKLSKFMFQASYGIRAVKYDGNNDYGRSYTHNNKLVEIDNQYAYTIARTSHEFTFKTNYQLNEKNSISLNYIGSNSHAEGNGINQNVYNENGSNVFKMNTAIKAPFDQGNSTLNLYYESILDTMGSNLTVSGQYASYDLERIENIHLILRGIYWNSDIQRRTFNTNDISVRSAQVDLNKVLSKQFKLESGLKYATITNRSLLNFDGIKSDGSYERFPEFSTDYDYAENISAAYTQLHWHTDNWNISGGLRAEGTYSEGISKLNIEDRKVRKYMNLFPSLRIQRSFSSNTKLTFNYNERIQRPSFQDLNPFTFYVDSLVSFKGNPLLVPERSKNLSASLQHKSISLNLSHTFTKNMIKTLIELTNPNEPASFNFKRDNIKSTREYAATLSFPIQKKWYSSYTSLTGRIENHLYLDEGILVSNQKPGVYIYTNQTFHLPASIDLELIYQYTSPRVDGIYTDNPISALSVAISKRFFNNSLLVRIMGNDIMDKYRFTGVASVYGNKWTYLSGGDYHYIKLSLNWNFGKLGISRLKDNKISREELNRISRK